MSHALKSCVHQMPPKPTYEVGAEHPTQFPAQLFASLSHSLVVSFFVKTQGQAYMARKGLQNMNHHIETWTLTHQVDTCPKQKKKTTKILWPKRSADKITLQYEKFASFFILRAKHRRILGKKSSRTKDLFQSQS